MSFTEDYRRAVKTLHELNTTKVTLSRRQEIARHTLQEQLEMHKQALEKEFGRPVPDQSDIDFYLANDSKGWERG